MTVSKSAVTGTAVVLKIVQFIRGRPFKYLMKTQSLSFVFMDQFGSLKTKWMFEMPWSLFWSLKISRGPKFLSAFISPSIVLYEALIRHEWGICWLNYSGVYDCIMLSNKILYFCIKYVQESEIIRTRSRPLSRRRLGEKWNVMLRSVGNSLSSIGADNHRNYLSTIRILISCGKYC